MPRFKARVKRPGGLLKGGDAQALKDRVPLIKEYNVS